jgi:predicted DNA binding CopG/RHH family protein
VSQCDTSYHEVTQDRNHPHLKSIEDAVSDEIERKERVLHTRVPESLDDAIRAAASELGMSVSNLVRNVLANALEVVEAATEQVPKRAAAAAASVRARAAAAEEAVPVLAWQEATLNLNAVCSRCNAILPRGTRAAIAIPDRPTAQRQIQCLPCVEELSRGPQP